MGEIEKGVAGRLRKVDGQPGCTPKVIARTAGLDEPRCGDGGCAGCFARTLSALADAIDAELAQARGESLRQGAMVWAKANGWPDFRDGEGFGVWIGRCAVKRPCFEDGEPVQSADMEEIGLLATCRVYLDGSWVFDPDKYEDTGNPKPWGKQCGTKNDRIKRPAPETLGADGLPIKAGEQVYLTASASRFAGTASFSRGSYSYGLHGVQPDEALFVKDPSNSERLLGHRFVLFDHANNPWCPASWLTHTPPDTQESIDEDALKDPCTYFGFVDDCKGCRSFEKERTCVSVMVADLLRRQRSLDGVGK